MIIETHLKQNIKINLSQYKKIVFYLNFEKNMYNFFYYCHRIGQSKLEVWLKNIWYNSVCVFFKKPAPRYPRSYVQLQCIKKAEII